MIKEDDSFLSVEQAYPALPKFNALREMLLGNERRLFLKEFGPVIAVLVLEVIAFIVLAVLHRRHLTSGPAFEQWYILSTIIPTFLSVIIIGIINIWRSRKTDSFEARWEREKEVSRVLSCCDPEEITDLHIRLENQLIINNQQFSNLIIDAAALSGLLAASVAVLAALMVDHKPFTSLMYGVFILGLSLIGLLLANVSLARDGIITKRLAGAVFKGLQLAKQRRNSSSQG